MTIPTPSLAWVGKVSGKFSLQKDYLSLRLSSRVAIASGFILPLKRFLPGIKTMLGALEQRFMQPVCLIVTWS